MVGRRHQLLGTAAVALLAALFASSPTSAQSTLSGERGTPLVPEADTVPAGEFNLSAAVTVMGAVPGDRIHAAPFGLTIGLWNRLEAGVAFRAMGRGLPQARGVEQDLSLSAKALVLTEYVVRPALSLALTADHPLQGWDFLPSAIAQKHIGPLLLVGQFGWRLPRKQRDADPAGPFYGAAAALAMSPSTTLMVQAAGEAGRGFANVTVMPGIAFSLLGPDPLEARRKALRQKAQDVARSILGDTPPPELTALLQSSAAADAAAGPAAWTGAGVLNSVRSVVLQHPGRITFFATGGPAFGKRATWSVFAGIQIASFDELLQDSDGDGIPDRFDKCPFEPEDWDGYQDEDGCPDNGAEVLKKLVAEARLKTEVKTPRFTTPFPRYRMSIPIRPIPTAPLGGDPREADRPRAPAALSPTSPPPPPPASPPPPSAPLPPPPSPRSPPPSRPPAPAEKQPAKPEPGRDATTPPLLRKPTRRVPGGGAPDAQRHDKPRWDETPARSNFASARLRVSPLLPPPIARWPGRAGRHVLDAMLLPLAGATSGLLPTQREALSDFATRAAQTGDDLEVWGRTSLAYHPDDAFLHASDIAAQATQLGHLPRGRAYGVMSLWPLAAGADVLVLRVAGAAP